MIEVNLPKALSMSLHIAALLRASAYNGSGCLRNPCIRRGYPLYYTVFLSAELWLGENI